MKKTLLILVSVFLALVCALIVFQIISPPLPKVESYYTEQKATMLTWRYKLDETLSPETSEDGEEPLVIYGVLIEKSLYENAIKTGVISRFAYFDMFGKISMANSDGNYNEMTEEQTQTLLFGQAEEYIYGYGTDTFKVPQNIDYDIPGEGEARIYYNTNKGVLFKTVTQTEFEESEFSKFYTQALEKIYIAKGNEQ